MDENTDTTGLSRRDLLKRSAVAGGLVWIAPTVLASPASAGVTCPSSQCFGVKHGSPNTGCEEPGKYPYGKGNCAALSGFTEFQKGCCLEPGLITFVESYGGKTHTYTLAPGVRFYDGFAKCATDCFRYGDSPEGVVVVTRDPATGITTVVMSCYDLSHSELMVCLSGSNLPVCP